MKIQFKKVLVLAPHTDDGEFGCGGTIAKLIAQGAQVFYMAFSVCEQSVPYGFKEDELERELYNATRTLGIPKDNVIVHKFEVRRFPDKRQEILQSMLDFKTKHSPDLVLMPSLNDLHQDHAVVAAEGLRAFKDTSILCYEMPWNNLSFTTSCFVELTEEHLGSKIAALECYKTQTFRKYADPNYIRSLAMTRGMQIKSDRAEVFEVVRMIFKND